MRQQVNINVDLTYDVDAGLSKADILDRVMIDIGRLENFGPALNPVQYCGLSITHILEEAEIYGNV